MLVFVSFGPGGQDELKIQHCAGTCHLAPGHLMKGIESRGLTCTGAEKHTVDRISEREETNNECV